MGVIISTKAYKKMDQYARAVKIGEVGGLILGKINGYGDVIVKDAIILKQYKNDSHFEIAEEAMMEFTKNADEKQLASILGWWHSHGKFGAFWSHDDDKCFERLCNLSNQCLGIVVSTKDQDMLTMRCRFDIKTKANAYVSMDEITPIVDMFRYKNQANTVVIDEKAILADINANVTDVDEGGFVECSKCGGTGVVRQTYFQRLLGGNKKKIHEIEDDYPNDESWKDYYQY